MKDAKMALEWVKDNIMHFGGDPNNITLIGHCTGASMIHFFMLNPACKGKVLVLCFNYPARTYSSNNVQNKQFKNFISSECKFEGGS